MDGATFSPTHSTPAAGSLAWDAPDPSRAASHRLDPYLPVVVLEETTGWAHVRCSNGWEAWIDGRALVPVVGGPLAATTPTPSLSLAGAFATIALPAAAVIVGSLLAWFSAAGESVNAWDIELSALFTHDDSSFDLKTGPVLLVLALGALVLIPARPAPRVLTIALGVLGALAFGIGALGVVLFLDLPEPRPDLGIGMLLTMTGGLALAAGGFLALPHATPTRAAAR